MKNDVGRLLTHLAFWRSKGLPGADDGPATHRRGREGEEAALHYLKEERGWQRIVRNWRSRKDEIDLIGWEAGILVFAEVRSRAESALVPGARTLSPKKQTAQRRAVRAYLRTLRGELPPFRYDVVEVTFGEEDPPGIRHHEAALRITV